MKDAYTILTVNPGSTGTKLGLVRGDEILLDLNVGINEENSHSIDFRLID